MQIKLKGISKRGRDRINQHGDTFNLVQLNEAIPGEKHDIILVESLNNTFAIKDKKTKNKTFLTWLGWFEVGKEVEIIKER